jgi:hypothetical protein
MTSPEMVLAERIRDEIVDLDRSVARASAAWERGKISALVPSKMQGLLERLPPLWNRLRAELMAFATFLEQIAPESP